MDTKMKKPLDTVNLAEEVSRGSDETDKLGARLARYHTAKTRALLNLETLKVLKPVDDFTAARYRAGAVRLADCGNYLAFRQYYTVGKTRLHKAGFCKQHLICPLCAIRRGAKTLDVYLKRYRFVTDKNPSWRLSMITLTIPDGLDFTPHMKQRVSVPIGFLSPAKGSIVYFIPKGSEIISKRSDAMPEDHSVPSHLVNHSGSNPLVKNPLIKSPLM